ncbi:dethiobiotin synthase [Pontiellaceae bacterium B1224]|nr:dethiobiotin synthase [Pontiellaceae bacterium B1224]
MNGLFVTGTDTDIGKTALSALLLAELHRRGTDAAPMKPAQTGCVGNVPDLDYSLSMAQMEVTEENYVNMAPYTFEPACSPHLAAEMAGTEIELAEIVIAARTLASEYEFIIAEGAGGILVPLNHRETMLDLMQALKLPILLAARPGLGTINHTLLSIRALRSDGLNIAGIVFVASKPGEPSFIEEDNGNTIEHFGNIPILGTIPYCAQLAEPNPNYNDLPIPVVAEIEKIVNQLGV